LDIHHLAHPIKVSGLSGYESFISSRRLSRQPYRSQAPGEPSRAFIDATPPADELIQRLGIRLVGHRVPHKAAPLAPCTLVGRCNRRARRARSISRPSAVHQATRSYTAVRYPAVPGGLAVNPGIADPLQGLLCHDRTSWSPEKRAGRGTFLQPLHRHAEIANKCVHSAAYPGPLRIRRHGGEGHRLRAGGTPYSAVLDEAVRPRHRVKRAAQALMPPFLRINSANGSESGLYTPAYLITRLHLLLVRLSALAGSAVQRMMAANGPSRSDTSSR